MRIIVIKSMPHPEDLGHGCEYNEDVKYLVRVAPNIKVTWPQRLWDTGLNVSTRGMRPDRHKVRPRQSDSR